MERGYEKFVNFMYFWETKEKTRIPFIIFLKFSLPYLKLTLACKEKRMLRRGTKI